MTDILEELLEAVVEEEIRQGVSLAISATAMPWRNDVGQSQRVAASPVFFGEIPPVEQRDWSRQTRELVEPEGLLWTGGAKTVTAVRRNDVRGEKKEHVVSEEEPSLVWQIAQRAQRARIAETMERRREPQGDSSGSGRNILTAVTSTMNPVMGRQSVAVMETARTVDRTIARDARRYDGGFLLG